MSLSEAFQPSQCFEEFEFFCEDGKALQRSLEGTKRVVATCKMSIGSCVKNRYA